MPHPTVLPVTKPHERGTLLAQLGGQGEDHVIVTLYPNEISIHIEAGDLDHTIHMDLLKLLEFIMADTKRIGH